METIDRRKLVPEEVLGRIFQHYDSLRLGFADAYYWKTLRLTYLRTLSDVLRFVRVYHSARDLSEVRILEIGAFCGILSTALRNCGFAVTAHDLQLFMKDPVLVAHYQEIGVNTFCADLRDGIVPADASQFNVIVCCEVLEHLNFNVLPILRELHRTLAPRGILYVATPNQANIVKRLALLRGHSVHDPVERLEWQLKPDGNFSIGLHWREYTRLELKQILEMTGFRVLEQAFCHYNNRGNSSLLRRLFVSGMYRMFPSFLPGQIAIAQKIE